MEKVINQLLELMAVFGIGVILVLVAGFWLFHRLKQDAEKQDSKPEQDEAPKS